MPELPEAETVRRGVAAAFSGRRIVAVEATGARSTRRHASGAEVEQALEGRRLDAVRRRGKYLVGDVEGGAAFVVHLGMSGQLLRAAVGEPRPRHTHLVWRFDAPAEELRFVDPRTFGQVWVTRPGPGGEVPELSHLGPDALDGLAHWRDLARVVEGRSTRIKVLLMDQRRLAGIGNLYADEVLFAARVAATRPAGSLGPAEIRRLHAAMTAVLAAAVEARGSSLADAQYRDIDGRVGGYQASHAAYGREGLPCPRCARPIVRRSGGGRSSFGCDHCQR